MVTVAIISSSERGKSCTVIQGGKFCEAVGVLSAPDLQRKVMTVEEGVKYLRRVVDVWEKQLNIGNGGGYGSLADK